MRQRSIRRGDLLPGGAISLLQIRPSREVVAERFFFGFLFRHHSRIQQAVLLADQPLDRILQGPARFTGLSCRFGISLRVTRQSIASRCPDLHLKRVACVALVVKLCNGEQPACRAGIAGSENEFAFGGPLRGPLEVIRCFQRLAVFIDAKERDVQIVSRVGEIVIVTAEECDLLFGRKDEADIGVLLEPVEPVFAAAVQRYYFTAETRFVARFFFDSGYFAFALLVRILVRRARLDGVLHAARDVFV